MKFSLKREKFLNEEIGVVKESTHETGKFISPIFLVPKSPVSYRLILNLKKLNENMPYTHFKMETINYILTVITPNCYMAKLDIKDAYCSIPILKEHQKYLKFLFGGKLYQFICLPNALCSGPRKFTKLLKAPLAYLHKRLINIAVYIDDLFTCSPSYVKCKQNVKCSINLLESLGFIIHPLFVPRRCFEYLGFVLNSQSMTISLSDVKKEKMKLLCSEILEDECPKIRTIAKLLGKFTSSFAAVQFGKLHYRSLEREKIQPLRLSKGSFDKKMKVPSAGKENIV